MSDGGGILLFTPAFALGYHSAASNYIQGLELER